MFCFDVLQLIVLVFHGGHIDVEFLQFAPFLPPHSLPISHTNMETHGSDCLEVWRHRAWCIFSNLGLLQKKTKPVSELRLPLKACVFLYGGDPRVLPCHSHKKFISKIALFLNILQITFSWYLSASIQDPD